MASFKAKYTPAEKKIFGQLLRQLMTDKGISGADLARRANLHIKSGKGMDRSMISWYVNGRSIPTPISLKAIAKVLEVDPQFMLVRDHSQKPGESAGPVGVMPQDVRISLEPGDMMHIMVNRRMPAEAGWRILEIIKALPQ